MQTIAIPAACLLLAVAVLILVILFKLMAMIVRGVSHGASRGVHSAARAGKSAMPVVTTLVIGAVLVAGFGVMSLTVFRVRAAREASAMRRIEQERAYVMHAQSQAGHDRVALELGDGSRLVITSDGGLQRVFQESGASVSPSLPAEAPEADTTTPQDAADEVSERDRLLAQIDSMAATVESSNVKLGGVAELLLQFRQLHNSLQHAYSEAEDVDKTAGTEPTVADGDQLAVARAAGTETLPAEIGESGAPLPEWVISGLDSPADDGTVVVQTRPCLTLEEAEQEVVELARAVVRDDYLRHRGGSVDWRPTDDIVTHLAIRRRFPERFVYDLGPVKETVFRVYAQVQPTNQVRNAIYADWRGHIVERRLSAAGLVTAGLVAIIAILAGYYRLDERTEGRWRKRLQFLTLVGLAGVGVCVAGASREMPDLMLERSLPTAREVESGDAEIVPQPVPSVDTPADVPQPTEFVPGNSANFLGLPVTQSRIAFVVAGDRHTGDGNQLEQVEQAVRECLGELDKARYKVFCSSSLGTFSVGGSTENPVTPSLRPTLERCFKNNAGVADPRKAFQAALTADPQLIVFVRDGRTSFGQHHVRRLTATIPNRIPVHCVEFGHAPHADSQMQRLAARTRGQYRFWNITDAADVETATR